MKALRVLLVILLLFGSFSLQQAWADSQVRIVRLSLVDGPVQLDRATGEGFERAIMNMPVAQGMQLWTRGDSRAEVEFEEGNTIRLTPGTRIEFTGLVLRSDGTRSTLVRIDSGRAYVDYSRKSGEDFRVQIGNREIALDKSVHFRIDVANDRAEVAVLNGELNADDLRVKKNNTAVLNLAAGESLLARGINPVVEDDWDKYRTDYHDKYAKASYNGSSFYGRSDLNYYGAWQSSPFGNCWRPYGFDASWDPYSAGAWALYPGYGYTFVSAYPWGWQPFHYGAWNYGGSSGWCWTPSRNFYAYGYTPVYHAPLGYVPVQPPQRPAPPARVGGGPIRPWQTGTGLVPVGDIDTTTWRARHNPGAQPWTGEGRHHRGYESGAIATGVATGGTGVTSSSSHSSAVASGSAGQPRYRGRTVNPDANDRGARGPRNADVNGGSRMQHDQQRSQQHEMRQEHRSFDRGSGGGSQAPRMSSPPPAAAPQMSAPRAAPAESRGSSRTVNPK